MALTIEHISDNARFEHRGDVHVTGHIGKNAVVNIIDGRLIVDGDIHDGTNVTANLNQNHITGPSLHVKGNIHENVRLRSENGNVRIEFRVGAHSSVKLTNGNIAIGSIAPFAKLTVMNGNVSVTKADAQSKVKLLNGNLQVVNANESAEINITYGKSVINGIHCLHPYRNDHQIDELQRLAELTDFKNITRSQFNSLESTWKKHIFERSCTEFLEAANLLESADPIYASSALAFIQEIKAGANLNCE